MRNPGENCEPRVESETSGGKSDNIERSELANLLKNLFTLRLWRINLTFVRFLYFVFSCSMYRGF